MSLGGERAGIDIHAEVGVDRGEAASPESVPYAS